MANSVKVLIIDDSATLCLIMARALEKAGYQVLTASDANEGLVKALRERPHCVIIDVVLPGISGFGLCRQLRAVDPQRNLSIIMISTKNTSLDHTWGLRQGADRYLAKPFAMQELVARVGALGRRYAEESAVVLRVDNLAFSLADHKVTRDSHSIDLSIRELTLLKALMREPGRIFTRTELCERVWERKHDYDTRLVEVFIGRLRKKLGQPSLIHTVRHVGYTIDEPK